MRRFSSLRWAVSALALAGSAPALAISLDTLQAVAGSYNVFLSGNLGTALSPYGADSIGAVAVGGNVYATGASFDSGGYGPYSLIVGGNLTESGGTDTGNVYVGGAGAFTNGATVLASAGATGSLTDKGSSLSMTGGSAPPGGIIVSNTTSVGVPAYMAGSVTHSSGISPPLDLLGTSTDLANASTSLGTLAATHVTSSGGAITLTLTQSGVNVIDLSVANGATINGITINAANGVTPTGLIVNVTGDNLSFNGGSYLLGPLNQHEVMFNFTNATSLNLTSLAFEGSLLAPLATVNFTSGDIDGSLMADNFTGSGEFHEFAFTTTLPPILAQAAREPASLALLAAGLAALGWIRRRSRAKPAIVGVIALGLLSAAPSRAADNAAGTSALDAAMPQVERDYIKAVLESRHQYLAAHSTEARKGIRAALQIRVHQLLGLDHEARSWIGTVHDIQTLPGGERAVSIALAPDVTVSTWRNGSFDSEYATLIRPSSALYHALDDAGMGGPVRFSATLIGSRITSDDEMVGRPELIARFSALKQLD